MTWRIPLADLDYGPEESQAVQRVLDRKWLTMGAISQEFERDFADFTGARHAIAVTNCTAGLHLACLAAGLQSGDEVILPALTFVASAASVRYTGATPVFADITSLDNLTLDPASVEASLTPRTRAIMVMHYAGYACDMPAILDIARRHNLVVIEDAAHAAGAWLDGRHLGTWGAVSSFSFFSNKNLATGEGGMLLTHDDALAERLRRLRSHGMTSLTWDRHQGHAWSYDVVDLGYNYRIDEIRAAIGIEQLRKLADGNRRRAHLTQRYRDLIAARAPGVCVPFEAHPGQSAFHILPVILPEGSNRSQVMDHLKSAGIQSSIHYPPIHQFTHYRQQTATIPTLPLTEAAASREVTLPLYATLKDEEVSMVVQALSGALAAQRIV